MYICVCTHVFPKEALPLLSQMTEMDWNCIFGFLKTEFEFVILNSMLFWQNEYA